MESGNVFLDKLFGAEVIFCPKEVNVETKSINQKMKMNYFPIKRNSEEFKQFITDKIDILEGNQIPNKS